MEALLNQLSLDKTFFSEFFLIGLIFILLSRVYFRPFLKLFQARHKKMVQDRVTAEKLFAQAETKLEEYQGVIAKQRLQSQRELEAALLEVRKQEHEIMAQAREDVKKITQEALESMSSQRQELKNQIQNDVETIAQSISERLLSRKV